MHHDGMSTDDEQPDADRLSFDKKRELILDDARHVFEYVTEQLSSVAALKQKFEHWKRDFGESYEQACIPLCLVKLLVPFVRLQVAVWNPIEKPESPESCRWDDAFLFYGEDTSEDPDLCLLPRIVEHVLLPKNGWSFWSCLKLMKNVLSWQGLLAEEPLKELSLCGLLNRYLMVALQAGLSKRVVSTLPTSRLGGSQLPQLQLLTRFLRLYLPHLVGVSGSSNLGPDMHASNALQVVRKLLASLTDKAK
ncbi:hypothetical protein MRX96_013544 [Rhipicephalus microplus]